MSNSNSNRKNSPNESEISNGNLPESESCLNNEKSDNVSYTQTLPPEASKTLGEPPSGQGEGNVLNIEMDSVIASTTEGEVTLGLSTTESSVTMSGLSDTNQLNFEESLKDFTAVDPSDDIELMNFGDVGNIEPNLVLKDEFFPTSNPNLGIDVNELDNVFASNDPSLNRVNIPDKSVNVTSGVEKDSVAALRLESDMFVSDSLAETLNEFESKLTTANIEPVQSNVSPNVLVTKAKPLNALSLLAMNYDNDDCDLEYPSPTLSDDTSDDKILPIEDVNILKPVEPDSTTTLVPLVENTAPTDFLDIDTLPETLNDLENSSDIPLDELGVEDSTLDSVLNPILESLPPEIPIDPSIASLATAIHEPLLENFEQSSNISATSLSSSPSAINPESRLEPLNTNKLLIHPESTEKENPDLEAKAYVVKNSVLVEETAKNPSEDELILENIVAKPVCSNDEVIWQPNEDKDDFTKMNKNTIPECVSSTTETTVPDPVYATEDEKVQQVKDNSISKPLGHSPEVEYQTVSEPVSTTKEIEINPLLDNLLPEISLPINEDEVSSAEEVKVLSEPIVQTNEAEISSVEDINLESLPKISTKEHVSSTVDLNYSPVQDLSLPITISSTQITLQPQPDKNVQVSESASSTEDQAQTLLNKPVLPEIPSNKIIKTLLTTVPAKEYTADEVSVQLIPDTTVQQTISSIKENEIQPFKDLLFVGTTSNIEEKIQILPEVTPKVEAKFQRETAHHQGRPETVAIEVKDLSKAENIKSQSNKEIKVHTESLIPTIEDAVLVPEHTLRETIMERLDKIVEKRISKPISPESPTKISIPKTGPASPSKKTVTESRGLIPTIKITSSGVSVVEAKPSTSSISQTSKPTGGLESMDDLIVQKHSTESVTPTRIIIRPVPPFNPSEVTPVRSVKPLILKHSKDPIPRLVIKSVSATRPVASVETLPSRSDTIQPSTPKTSQTSKPTESLSVPSIKIVTKPGEAHSIVKRPNATNVESQLTIKRSHLEKALTKEVTPTAFQIQTETRSQSSKNEKVEYLRSKTVVSPIINNLDSNDVMIPATEPILDVEPEEDEALAIAKTIDQPEPMDFDVDIYAEDDASLMNEASLPASLCENDDFSFVKPKSADDVDGKSGTVPFIEEDTQSSWSLDPNKLPKLKEIETPSKAIDEESRGSVSSKKSVEDANILSAAALGIYEYQWPVEKGEFYMLQEHLCEFLGVKSFKRKHPDLPRRNVDLDERQYLRESNAVSETQCDLGLTALRSEDVMELMSKDYPEKYQDYIRSVQEKQRLALEKKNKEFAAATLDKNKMKELLRKAMKSASEYNAHLNQERRDERRMSFDLQTYTIHVPASKKRKLDPEMTKVGKFPVALIPGQYQDYYREYNSNELKYLPINSVVYGPLQELNSINVPPGSDGSQSESDSDSDGSCCSSSFGTQDSGDSSSGSDTATNNNNNNNNNKNSEVFFKPKEVQSPCKICHGTPELNKHAQPEELIHCSQCKTSAHPTCLELPAELVKVIKTYDWLCMDCKTCITCGDPYDEEKLMFCDKCDRGFHTYCVGLRDLPKGRWMCQLCGKCALCGSKTPGPEGTKLQWQLAAGEGNKKPQLLCVACSKKKAK